MSPLGSAAQEALRQLQSLVRRPQVAVQEHSALTFRLPDELATPGSTMLSLGAAELAQMNIAAAALGADLEFEHIEKPQAALQIFVAHAWTDQVKDHVPDFFERHRRKVLDLVCYLTVEHLSVTEDARVLLAHLLPLTDPRIPTGVHRSKMDGSVGCVAAINVRGTSYRKMAERARITAAHALRVLRIALRDQHRAHDQQLRFRLGASYAFSDGLDGWASPSDTAYELTLTPDFTDAVERTPVWMLTAEPVTDIDRKADLALRWMERARFSAEPLIALLYLFFALEALLGEKSERLKADGLAFRQAMLSHINTASFHHPNETWLLYANIRSAAVHGEHVPDVDEATVRSFEWTVRNTLNEYLTLARDRGLTSRRALLKVLRNHPDRPKLIEWLRDNGGPDMERT